MRLVALIRSLIVMVGFLLVASQQLVMAQANDKTPQPKGIVPGHIREGEAANAANVTKAPYFKGKNNTGFITKKKITRKYTSRWTRAPYVPAKVGPGGGDLAWKNAIQYNQSILNWEYRPGYYNKDGWWTRLQKEWFPEQYFRYHPDAKRFIEQLSSTERKHWEGDAPATNRGSYEEMRSAEFAEFIGRGVEDKRNIQAASSAEIAAWTGNYEINKIEREREKAKQLSDWTGNYFTNKEEVQRKKAEQLADFDGDLLNDKKKRQDRTASDSRDYDGTIRIKNAYLRSHDSQSQYRVIPKGKRDKKEKDLWYD